MHYEDLFQQQQKNIFEVLAPFSNCTYAIHNRLLLDSKQQRHYSASWIYILSTNNSSFRDWVLEQDTPHIHVDGSRLQIHAWLLSDYSKRSEWTPLHDRSWTNHQAALTDKAWWISAYTKSFLQCRKIAQNLVILLRSCRVPMIIGCWR